MLVTWIYLLNFTAWWLMKTVWYTSTVLDIKMPIDNKTAFYVQMDLGLICLWIIYVYYFMLILMANTISAVLRLNRQTIYFNVLFILPERHQPSISEKNKSKETFHYWGLDYKIILYVELENCNWNWFNHISFGVELAPSDQVQLLPHRKNYLLKKEKIWVRGIQQYWF